MAARAYRRPSGHWWEIGDRLGAWPTQKRPRPDRGKPSADFTSSQMLAQS